MASKKHTISVKIPLYLSAEEAAALKNAYKTSTAQVLKSTKRRDLIQFETNDPPVTGTSKRRKKGSKAKATKKGSVKK